MNKQTNLKAQIVKAEEVIGDTFFNTRSLYKHYRKKYYNKAYVKAEKSSLLIKYQNIKWQSNKKELFWSLFDYYIYKYFLIENGIDIMILML